MTLLAKTALSLAIALSLRQGFVNAWATGGRGNPCEGMVPAEPLPPVEGRNFVNLAAPKPSPPVIIEEPMDDGANFVPQQIEEDNGGEMMPENRMMSHNIGPDFNGVPSPQSPPSRPPRPPFSQYAKTRIQLGRNEDDGEIMPENRMMSHNIGPNFNGVPSPPSPPPPAPRTPFHQYSKTRIQLGRR